MAKNVYPISFNINLLKSKKELYKLDQDNQVATNVFLGDYKLINDEDRDNIIIDKKRKANYNDLKVIIKCFKLENLNKDDYELIIHEANYLRQLKHRNIIPLLANFVNNNQIWLIMPIAEYGSCYLWSRPFGLDNELSIALILRDVLLGVDYLHSQGIIHRGIRSSRVLIDSNGRCILTGIRHSTSCISNGKWLNVVHDYPSTAKNNINWYSPELIGIGILGCELANGIVPFEPLSPTELLLDKLTGYLPRLLDKTCDELKTLDLDKMDTNNQTRFELYKSRRFSDYFHHLLLECCLISDTNRRYSAKNLLEHKFFKQIKRSHNLLNLLPKLQFKDDQQPQSSKSTAKYNLMKLKTDLCESRCKKCSHCKFSGFIDSHFMKSDRFTNDQLEIKWNF